MYYQEFYYWCRDAARKIKYPPDRKKVYAELYGHMMDRYESHLEKGLSPAEAEEKTLKAMGNADELAIQLAAIHRPFLGYALVIARILTVVLLVVTLTCGIRFFREQNFVTESEPGTWGGGRRNEKLAWLKSETTDQCDGYTFRVTAAELWRSRDSITGIKNRDYLYLRLEVTNPNLWAPEQKAWDAMWAVDSNGTRYDTIIREADVIPKTGNFGVNEKWRDWNTYHYDLCFSDFSADSQWVELHYDREGRDLVLRVELTGGDGG